MIIERYSLYVLNLWGPCATCSYLICNEGFPNLPLCSGKYLDGWVELSKGSCFFTHVIPISGPRKTHFCLEENIFREKKTVSDFLDDLPLNILRQVWYQLNGASAHCSGDVTGFFTPTWFFPMKCCKK